MSSRIDIPIHYLLPKHPDTHKDFAEEIYLIDAICLPGHNLEFQNIGDKFYIAYEGSCGDFFVEGTTRLDALRKLYSDINSFKYHK